MIVVHATAFSSFHFPEVPIDEDKPKEPFPVVAGILAPKSSWVDGL